LKNQTKILDPQKALSLFQQGKLNEAMAILIPLLKESPQFATGWFLLGVIQFQNNELQSAIESLLNATRYQAIYPDAYNNLGVVYEKIGNIDDATIAYKTAIEQKPSYANALYNLANIYKSSGKYDVAIDYYHRAINVDPNYTNALINLGSTYQTIRNHEKAIKIFNQALLLSPNDITLLNNIGLSYLYHFQYDEALTYFQKSLSLAPGLSSGLINIGQVLQAKGEFIEAKQYFEKAMTDPQQTEIAKNNIGLLHLGQLELKEGWEFYRARSSIRNKQYSIPETLPNPLEGLNILLTKDQGLGDELFFLRFVTPLIDAKANITYQTDSRLTQILVNSMPSISILDSGSTGPYDYCLPVSELPRLLFDRLPIKIPDSIKLKTDRDLESAIATTLPNNNKKNIAITWQAGTVETNKLYKRIDPELMGKMFSNVDANILVLQRNPSKKDIKNLEKSLGRKTFNFSYINNSLDETLAFLNLVDEYVTVSNTNVHLMVGLGKKLKIFVPFPPEWRWTFNEQASPWFPDIPLYRQDASGCWNTALSNCLSDLEPDLSS